MINDKKIINNKLLILSVSTIVAYFSFELTRISLDETLVGMFQFNLGGFLFIIPTATILSVLFSLFVYLTLKSFLYGASNIQDERKFYLSKETQLISLTVITAYAAFNIEKELLKFGESGVINLNVAHDFTIFIPTVLISTIALTWVVFTILMRFFVNYAQNVGKKQGETLRKMSEVINATKTDI